MLEYCASIDFPIFEACGHSEWCGPHTSNSLSSLKIGSAGHPLFGTETKVGRSSGELLFSGRHIFAVHLNIEEQTKENIKRRSW